MNFSHVFTITYHPKFKFTHFAFILSLILKRPSTPMGPVDQMFQHSSIHWGLIAPSDHETSSMKNWNFEINLNLLKNKNNTWFFYPKFFGPYFLFNPRILKYRRSKFFNPPPPSQFVSKSVASKSDRRSFFDGLEGENTIRNRLLMILVQFIID